MYVPHVPGPRQRDRSSAPGLRTSNWCARSDKIVQQPSAHQAQQVGDGGVAEAGARGPSIQAQAVFTPADGVGRLSQTLAGVMS